MKFLLFASALAVLSSASARDDRRRRTSTGTIHFSEQVDDALTLIQKGTNSKVDRSPIQQLIYKEDDSGGGSGKGGGGGDKGGKDDDDDNDRKGSGKNKDDSDETEEEEEDGSDGGGGDTEDDKDDEDRKGGGDKKDSSSSNDRRGGKSSSSSSNDRKGDSSSSSSSSGDAPAIDDICNLGHNACDHDNKGKKGSDSDELASKIECDIVCSSTLCSHDDREHMGCPPTPSSTAKFVQKGAEFKNAAFPIQQLIFKTEEEDGSDGGGDKDDDDNDRKGGGNKDSSSSKDRKGNSSSSSSSKSSSSSGDNGPSNDGFCDLDYGDLNCGADNLTTDEQALCDVACLACDIKPPGCPTSGDGERAWKKNLRQRNRKYD